MRTPVEMREHAQLLRDLGKDGATAGQADGWDQAAEVCERLERVADLLQGVSRDLVRLDGSTRRAARKR